MSDDNVTPLLNRKTLGLEQLEQFDSDGVPGPFTTAEMAFTKVREQADEIKRLKRLLGYDVPEPSNKPQEIVSLDE